MLPYQEHEIGAFLSVLPSSVKQILEIGSDIKGEVAAALTRITGATVVGLNPAPHFPRLEERRGDDSAPLFVRGDGCTLPFPDASFDAALSIATMEHVGDIGLFMSEVARVLRPDGVFYTSFGPIWSSATGHHVCATAGKKEARFWKPGRNPIPDFAHLLMTPDELRTYLMSGPCCDELIEPIIKFIYHENTINRRHFEDYVEMFRNAPLAVEAFNISSAATPDAETLEKLRSKFGAERNLECSNISAALRKTAEVGSADELLRRIAAGGVAAQPAPRSLLVRFVEWVKLNPKKVRLLAVFFVLYTIALLVVSQLLS